MAYSIYKDDLLSEKLLGEGGATDSTSEEGDGLIFIELKAGMEKGNRMKKWSRNNSKYLQF